MPSLSELSAIYSNRPYAPAQDVNNTMQQGFSGLGGAIDHAREEARQNAPVSPWQKAIMRLMQGHDPKEVAADTKSALGQGGGAQSTPVQQQPQSAPPIGSLQPGQEGPQYLAQPPPPTGYAAQMPQTNQAGLNAITGQGSGYDSGMTGMERPMGGQQMPQRAPVAPRQQTSAPQGQQQALGDSMYDGMTSRDFDSFVKNYHTATAGRQQKSQADLMALEQERTKRAMSVADIGAGAKKDVAQTGAESRQSIEDAKRQHEVDKLQFEKDKESHQVSLRKDYQDILRNRAEYYKQVGMSKVGQDPKVKAALEKEKSAAAAYKSLISQPMNNLTGEGKALESKLKLEWEQRKSELDDAVNNSKPQEQNGTSMKEGGKGVMRTYKNKKTGQTISATPGQFQEAVTGGKIQQADWE